MISGFSERIWNIQFRRNATSFTGFAEEKKALQALFLFINYALRLASWYSQKQNFIPFLLENSDLSRNMIL